MTLTVTPCTDPSQWDETVMRFGGHPLQLWGWGDLKSSHRWRAERVIVTSGDRTVASCQLLTRPLPWPLGGFVYAPRGPVFARNADGKLDLDGVNPAEIVDAIAAYVRGRQRAVALSIEPDEDEGTITFSSRWRPGKTHVLPARTLILDLTKSTDELMAGMSKKHRQYVRKSGREAAVTIRPVTTVDELRACLEVYRETSERADFGLHEDQYYIDAFSMLGDNAPVWASYVDDQPVAFLFLAASSRTAFELYGGMNDVGQRLRANYALKWHAICEMKDRGATRYDLGGLINDGVTTFKKGFASHENLLIGTWDLPGPGYALWTKGVPLAKRALRALRRR